MPIFIRQDIEHGLTNFQRQRRKREKREREREREGERDGKREK
jgi:hypothetical protein